MPANMPAWTYRDAGVDIGAANAAKRRIKSLAAATQGTEVLGVGGGFAGLYELSGYRNPVLVSGTDNVGTKLKIALAMGRFEGLGHDVVNACVNDVITCGAKPLFFLDYIALGKMNAALVERIVRGVAGACEECGCALIGGETSELPGLLAAGEFDLSGFAVGAIEKDAILDGSRIVKGDLLIGLPSNGLHTNGYSLARAALGLDEDPSPLFERPAALGCSIGEALLRPHRSYYPIVRPALAHLKGMSHITGGGLLDNTPRMLPDGLAARFDPSAWDVPPIFSVLRERGGIDAGEMYRVFNMGLGMVMACGRAEAEAVVTLAPGARVVGEAVDADGGARVRIDGVGADGS